MNAPDKAALWARINELLLQHEREQSDAVRLAIAEAWDKLRQRLTLVALDETNGANGG